VTATSILPAAATAGETVARMTGITKSFLGNTVLRDVDLELRSGEVHALVGENGAGKSTLMKILCGIHQADAGEVVLDGAPVSFRHPREAQDAGIAIIHQELTLLPDRTVAENVFLGREPRRRFRVDAEHMVGHTREMLAELGAPYISPTATAGHLPVAHQQVVEIAKALVARPRVLAMDEPTAALADAEVAMLYALVRRLAERGLAVLYVSHRMREVFDLSQQVTVLKDGALVATRVTAEITSEQVVRLMVGRPLGSMFPARAAADDLGDARLELQEAGNDRLSGITLQVRAGEIVGVAGLQGSGRSALARAVCGVQPFTRGRMLIDGEACSPRTPRESVDQGIAYVTEDRKGEGLALWQSVRDNMLLVHRNTSRTSGAVDVPALGRSVNLVSRSLSQEVRYLSGGNQQKVVLAKWLAIQPRLLVVDEPTRGIDVGAKTTVYDLLRDRARAGIALLVISSELPELIGLCDRIVVMHEGAVAGELPADPTEEQVMSLATGHTLRLDEADEPGTEDRS
jgi:ABC-type sugar transport system ATPase subunit